MNALTDEGRELHAQVKTEEEWKAALEILLDNKPWGWAGPSTWCTMFGEEKESGAPSRIGTKGYFYFVVANAKVFMNPWAEEGFIFLKNLPYAKL